MNLVNDLQYEISRTINTLRRRHGNTSDAAEKKALTRVIAALNRKIAALDQASLLEAAEALGDVIDDVERAVAAVKTGPFDGYLAALEEHLRLLYQLSGQMHAREALPAAPDDGMAPAAAPRKARSRGVATRGGSLDAPLPSKDFAALCDEYQAYYDGCEVRPGNEGSVAYYVKRLLRGRPVYEEVGADLNGIPWAFIGVLHGMECGFSFAGHLHNGDPLGARTVHVPAGRPQNGLPPFTWRQSAADALTMKGFDQVSDWSTPHMLYLIEKYNGFGYRMRRLPTPYLWSFSNRYEKGKYVADGRFDPNAVSKQCGAALMLKAAAAA